MLGMIFTGDRDVSLQTFPDPVPGPLDVVLRVRASGLCGTDLHSYRRPAPLPPIIAGHEPCGEIVAVGAEVSGDIARIGALVMVHHYNGCGCCPHCQGGWTQMCRTGTMQLFGYNAHGGHADFLVVPAHTLVPLDDSLSFAAGAAIACGTGTAWGALERMALCGRDTIAIFGQGPVGLSATMLAAAQGARVIALDISQERRERALAFGAERAVDPADGGAVDAIRVGTHGKGASKILETSGSASAGRDALRALAPWGTACFVGLGDAVPFNTYELLTSQVTVMTSLSMSIIGQRACADFVVARKLDLDRLFTHRWHLRDAAAAYREFDRQTSGKAVFLFD